MFGGIFLRFVVFGDSKGKKNGINEKVLEKIMHNVRRLEPQPEFIVHLGDMTSGSSNPAELKSLLERFKKIIGCYYPLENLYPVIGNHDTGDNKANIFCEKIFRDVFSEYHIDCELEGYNCTAYCFKIEDSSFIVLNSMHYGEEYKISGEQLEWLRRALMEPARNKFLFVHSPPFPTGAHINTCLDRYCELRDMFWSVVDDNCVDIVFSGHEHNYSRRVIDNSFSTEKYKFRNRIYQIVSGGGGEKLKKKFRSKKGVIIPPIDKFHFVIVDVEQDKISVEAVSTKGKSIDKFIVNK